MGKTVLQNNVNTYSNTSIPVTNLAKMECTFTYTKGMNI